MKLDGVLMMAVCRHCRAPAVPRANNSRSVNSQGQTHLKRTGNLSLIFSKCQQENTRHSVENECDVDSRFWCKNFCPDLLHNCCSFPFSFPKGSQLYYNKNVERLKWVIITIHKPENTKSCKHDNKHRAGKDG